MIHYGIYDIPAAYLVPRFGPSKVWTLRCGCHLTFFCSHDFCWSKLSKHVRLVELYDVGIQSLPFWVTLQIQQPHWTLHRDFGHLGWFVDGSEYFNYVYVTFKF